MTLTMTTAHDHTIAGDRTTIGAHLALPLFHTLCGTLAGHPYLKVVVDRAENTWHLLDAAVHPFHVDYIATRVLGMELAELDACLDAFNASVYADPERRFLLGVLSLHTDTGAGTAGAGADAGTHMPTGRRARPFLVLETTEADTMSGPMLEEFYTFVRHRLDSRLPLLLKPANHGQEHALAAISDVRVPRILSHQLFGSRTRTPLNPGEAVGRLRHFRTAREYEQYAAGAGPLGGSDIVAMPCLPDDVPRVAGFINTAPTTPLSHTNVLASGWGIPNAIIRDLDQLIEAEELAGAWVRYEVQDDDITLVRLPQAPASLRQASGSTLSPLLAQSSAAFPQTSASGVADRRPTPRIRLKPPLLHADIPALPLHQLRRTDQNRYGTKAANLGELHHVLAGGEDIPAGKSEHAGQGPGHTIDLTAYYGRPRPPRADLFAHLTARLTARQGLSGLPSLPGHSDLPALPEGARGSQLRAAARDFVRATVTAPDGIALPFALQHRFLTSSPALQQGIGDLKAALERGTVDTIDPLCRRLQHLIQHAAPMPDDVARAITAATQSLPSGASGTPGRLVVRSSSNAEDLPGFSAAGVYDSVTAVHGADELLAAVRRVWASLLSPRSVRLRHQAGISPDDTYMGVIIQRYQPADLGGVLVTCNPTRRADFRNVYLNCSSGSPENVVDGTALPLQYLYNTVEGGGRTVALGSSAEDLPPATRERLADLALTGRLLQSHFSGTTPTDKPDGNLSLDLNADRNVDVNANMNADLDVDVDVDRPLDIEWLMTDQGDFHLVQIRPYAAR
ncbi:PEP/pyruvate-binding domain-containing protein [Streptomyces sp. N2A]|uniref:PEP/pyruvate-binding domain-containing protein n=1 Tax=Streptomyces sp. N2A TaxID=3073936 RepID=UPI00286FC8F6|nr:PEP/pyruvate-binding domain-containing protein [Streptomyces sp. N2A]